MAPGQSVAPRAESITVIAEPVPADTLAGTHTILDREEIVRSGARDAAELLRFVAVVHLSQAGSKGSLSSVSIRAAKPNFTLVLIDGVPANDIGDLLGGAFNFATLSADEIERVDILRGPLSSIYGSEAVGGVISIVLRRPADGPVMRLSTEGGEFGYGSASGGLSRTWKRLGLSGDGGFSRMGQQVLDDGFASGDASLKADVSLGGSKHVQSFMRWNRLASTSFPVSSGGPAFAISRAIEHDRADQIVSGTNYQQQVGTRWFYTAGGDVFSRVAVNDTPAIFDRLPPGPSYVPSTASATRFMRWRVLTVQQVHPARWLSLYAVTAFRQENGTSVGNLAGYLPASYALSRPTFSFSGNGTVTKGKLAVTGGFGLEKSNTYHTVISPRVGGSYALAKTRLRASWGKGFKLPSFYALGSPLVGNPKLVPEFGTGFDAGVEREFAPAATKVSLTYFDNRYRDLVDFDPTVFRLVNDSHGYGRGLELEASAAVRRVRIGGEVSYLDAGLKETANRLRDVPRWSEQIRMSLPVTRAMGLDIATVWVGRRYDYQVPVPQYSTVGAYSITNAKLRWNLREGLEGTIRVENPFDRKYQEFVGFPSPGIYASAGLTYTRPRKATP
ncbi:Outer membrane vitamin B12 receptor BtuB [Granulicella sibirica]|uniref:Outer membrane vitamin B12 receptor BtuB n=2 Tax=Granulicella sibirica TaxID=2479048 RepID=A0A4Q0T9H2_9BACT|nr:Outer membrane vitamin B12 receptor BtuB [Granulicella sibirica]